MIYDKCQIVDCTQGEALVHHTACSISSTNSSPKTTHSMSATISTNKALSIRRHLVSAMPQVVARMGPIRGDTSMEATITTYTESKTAEITHANTERQWSAGNRIITGVDNGVCADDETK